MEKSLNSPRPIVKVNQTFIQLAPGLQGLACAFPHQFPPLLMLLRILPFQTMLSRVPLYHMTPLIPWSPSHTFHLTTCFSTPSHHHLSVTHVPSHLNRFRFITSDTNSIPILSLSSALYPSETPHTTIVPSSSLSATVNSLSIYIYIWNANSQS